MKFDIEINLDNFFYEKITHRKNQKSEYITEKAFISNFIMEAKKIVKSDNNIEIHVEFCRKIGEKIKKNNLVFDIDDFQDSRSFRKKINRQYINYEFTGNDLDIEKIKAQLGNTCPIMKTGLDYTGLVKDKETWKYIDKNTQDEKYLTLNTNVTNETFNVEDIPTEIQLKEISKLLFSFNDDIIVYPVLAISIKSILHERLKNVGIKVFNGNLTGESGSGKSTTFETIIQSINHSETAEISANIKEFATMKEMSSSNIIPCNIEEYKEHTLSKNRILFISSMARSAYDGHQTKRGRIDQGINKYQMKSDLNIIGETSFDETAIKERSMIVIFSKKRLNKEFIENMKQLKRKKNILVKLGNLVLSKVLSIRDKYLLEIYDKYKKLSEDMPDRIQSNIAVSMICYSILFDIFNPIYEMKSFDEVFKILQDGQKKFNQNEISSNIIESTFEIFSIMIENKILNEKEDFVIKRDLNQFCLRLTQTYNKFTKYIKEFNIQTELYLKKSSFANQVEQTDFFIDKNKSIRDKDWVHNKEVQKCYIFDLEKLQRLDFFIKPTKYTKDGNVLEIKEDYKDSNDKFWNDLPLPDD